MTDDRIISREGMSMKSHNELKVSLLGIRSALFAHVIAGRFGEMEATNRYLSNLTVLKVNPEESKVI